MFFVAGEDFFSFSTAGVVRARFRRWSWSGGATGSALGALGAHAECGADLSPCGSGPGSR